jgi:hypothetical protein
MIAFARLHSLSRARAFVEFCLGRLRQAEPGAVGIHGGIETGQSQMPVVSQPSKRSRCKIAANHANNSPASRINCPMGMPCGQARSAAV